jgi:hypothetical protein
MLFSAMSGSTDQVMTDSVSSTPLVTQLAEHAPLRASTVPANGDENPYGVVFVPSGDTGDQLVAGDILVSNFNNSSNLQGTGTTIVEINPKTGQQLLFFRGPQGLGLTTALGVLSNGDVIVGDLAANAQGAPAGRGGLLIINKHGQLIQTLTDPRLRGPWDLTVLNSGTFSTVFVSNVLSGTVTRLDLTTNQNGTFTAQDDDIIASGFTHRTDPNAFVVGPTGVVLDQGNDTLYVATTGDNEVFAVPHALTRRRSTGEGKKIFTYPHLRGPLGLGLAPNGDLLTANGDAINPDPANLQNSEIVEFTKSGKFVGQFQVDTAAGGAFGLAGQQNSDGSFTFAAVDDVTNELDIWQLTNKS